MADMDSVAQVEMPDHGGGVGGVMIHVVGDDAVAVGEEEQQLRVPVVGAERPAVMEHQRLGILRSPVLVEYLGAVLGRDDAHLAILPVGGSGRLQRQTVCTGAAAGSRSVS